MRSAAGQIGNSDREAIPDSPIGILGSDNYAIIGMSYTNEYVTSRIAKRLWSAREYAVTHRSHCDYLIELLVLDENGVLELRIRRLERIGCGDSMSESSYSVVEIAGRSFGRHHGDHRLSLRTIKCI